MKRSLTTILLVAITALLAPSAMAQNEKPLEPLAGAWVAESFNGKAPPKGMTMTMVFLDAKYIGMEITIKAKNPDEKDKVERTEVEYEATADGGLILYYDKEAKPEGDKAKWEVKADKKLYITNETGEVLVFRKKPVDKKPE